MAKRAEDVCFSPGSHRLIFALWQIVLAPFTLVIITPCCPGHTPSSSASCCVGIEICAPVSTRNFVNCCWGPTGIKMCGPLSCIHWQGSTCRTDRPNCRPGAICFLTEKGKGLLFSLGAGGGGVWVFGMFPPWPCLWMTLIKLGITLAGCLWAAALEMPYVNAWL